MMDARKIDVKNSVIAYSKQEMLKVVCKLIDDNNKVLIERFASNNDFYYIWIEVKEANRITENEADEQFRIENIQEPNEDEPITKLINK